MNPSMNYQTDLEVILEFLEEHCRQETRGLWDNADLHMNQQSIGDNYGILSAKSQPATGKEMGFDSAGLRNTVIQSLSMEETLNAPAGEERVSGQHTSPGEEDESSSTPAGRGEMVCLHPSTPCESAKKPHQSLYIVPGKKLRLFHFLFEMLEDPGMAHCLSWVPASVGVFRFSSTYKEHVAALWGQRKGNRRPMTYQKMSRALRNYTRSGEIIKVRKKLTYQFSGAVLTTLRSQQPIKNA